MAIFMRKHYTLKLSHGTLFPSPNEGEQPGGSGQIELGDRTLIMGILNVTPDSFSDGGRFLDYGTAVGRACELIAAGADILDIGGESTRPGSDPVPMDVELERVVPVIRAIRERSGVPISIDTNKAEVARQALSAGADIINDISSLRFDTEMAKVVAESGAPLIIMHMLGTPRTMQKNPVYASLIPEIISFLEERLQFAASRGIDRSQIVVDPGIGFGKTVVHNLSIIGQLDAFSCLDRPLLLGLSRKRFIGTVTGRPEGERELGTAVANAIGIAAGGAHIIRVHDVAFQKDAVTMADAIRGALIGS
ncbi:MAG: dihydropteroate synthase [Syntrophobacteraceae bacterium]